MRQSENSTILTPRQEKTRRGNISTMYFRNACGTPREQAVCPADYWHFRTYTAYNKSAEFSQKISAAVLDRPMVEHMVYARHPSSIPPLEHLQSRGLVRHSLANASCRAFPPLLGSASLGRVRFRARLLHAPCLPPDLGEYPHTGREVGGYSVAAFCYRATGLYLPIRV